MCWGCSKSASSVRPDRAFGHCSFCHGYLPRRSVSAILRVLGFSDPLKQQPKTTRPKRVGLWDARLPDFFVVPVTVEQYEELETSHIGIMRRPRGHAYAHWCSYLHSTEQTRERVQKQWQLWVAPEGEATCFEFHTFFNTLLLSSDRALPVKGSLSLGTYKEPAIQVHLNSDKSKP